jgi:hypothetical protein
VTIAAVSEGISGAANVTVAVMIYSNFGPGMAFDGDTAGHGWTINGFMGPGIGQQAIAEQFTPSADYEFATAQIALWLLWGPNSIRVFLQADEGGLPGTVIEEIRIDGLGAMPGTVTAHSATFPILARNTPYWLSVAAGADGVMAGWSWNSVGDVSLGTHAGTQGGGPAGPWGKSASPITRGAFQINGLPLPSGTGLIRAGPPAVVPVLTSAIGVPQLSHHSQRPNPRLQQPSP